MTYEELCATIPRVRGPIVLTGTDGKEYKTFVCYGCQSCWCFKDNTEEIEESYPHFLSPLKEVTSLVDPPGSDHTGTP